MTAKPLTVLALLVGGFFLVSIVFISKYNEMSTRLAGLEKKLDHLERTREQAGLKENARQPDLPAKEPEISRLPVVPPSPAEADPVKPPPKATGFTTQQEEAVARLVEKTMREKYPHLADGDADPIDEMEKLLELSPLQKARIAPILEAREAEMQKSALEGMKDFGEMIKKLEEMAIRYDGAIKAELSVAQQEKYDALKKEGKLQGGMMIKTSVKSGPPK